MRDPLIITDRRGETSVLPADDGDHIVTAFRTNRAGHEYEVPVPWDQPAWDRAVRRAERCVALVKTLEPETEP